MNQQQKNFVIRKAREIAVAYFDKLYKADERAAIEYNSIRVSIQQLLSEDRELLKTLPINEGLDVDASTSVTFNDVFDLTPLFEKKAKEQGLAKPDYRSRDHKVRMVGQEHYMRYQNSIDELAVMAKDMADLEVEVMLGSDEQTKVMIQEFTTKFS